MSSSGKGQSLVETKNGLQNAWKEAKVNSRGKVKGVIIEEFINFDFEFTLLTVRKENGEDISMPDNIALIGPEYSNEEVLKYIEMFDLKYQDYNEDVVVNLINDK